MPSWNIHIAQAERLLSREGAGRLGVRDIDAFFFGNLVPDVYVGYMVPDLDRKMRYCDTHLAEPESIPTPRARGCARGRSSASASSATSTRSGGRST